MDHDCSGGPADFNRALGLRIAGLFGILAAGLVGVAVPWLSSRASGLKGVFFLGKTFASGVVLATGFVHVLNGAVSFTQPCQGSCLDCVHVFLAQAFVLCNAPKQLLP